MSLLCEWRKWDPENFPYVLDMDAAVLECDSWKPRVVKHRSWGDATGAPDFCLPGDKRLHLGLIPVPFIGDMMNASIYILMINPGLGPADYFEYEVPSFQQALRDNLRQEHKPGVMPFLFLDPPVRLARWFRLLGPKAQGSHRRVSRIEVYLLGMRARNVGAQARSYPACSLSQRRIWIKS